MFLYKFYYLINFKIIQTLYIYFYSSTKLNYNRFTSLKNITTLIFNLFYYTLYYNTIYIYLYIRFIF